MIQTINSSIITILNGNIILTQNVLFYTLIVHTQKLLVILSNFNNLI